MSRRISSPAAAAALAVTRLVEDAARSLSFRCPGAWRHGLRLRNGAARTRTSFCHRRDPRRGLCVPSSSPPLLLSRSIPDIVLIAATALCPPAPRYRLSIFQHYPSRLNYSLTGLCAPAIAVGLYASAFAVRLRVDFPSRPHWIHYPWSCRNLLRTFHEWALHSVASSSRAKHYCLRNFEHKSYHHSALRALRQHIEATL